MAAVVHAESARGVPRTQIKRTTAACSSYPQVQTSRYRNFDLTCFLANTFAQWQPSVAQIVVPEPIARSSSSRYFTSSSRIGLCFAKHTSKASCTFTFAALKVGKTLSLFDGPICFVACLLGPKWSVQGMSILSAFSSSHTSIIRPSYIIRCTRKKKMNALCKG